MTIETLTSEDLYNQAIEKRTSTHILKFRKDAVEKLKSYPEAVRYLEVMLDNCHIGFNVDSFKKLCEKHNMIFKDFMMVLRIAVSGRLITPELFTTFELLGFFSCYNRFEFTLKCLKEDSFEIE